MIHKHAAFYLHHLKHDIPAGLVVFLVALPLCLGIALASGAPLFSGLIAGLVGGLVVSWLSGSQLCVSGPAAGLTVIVLTAIQTLGSFQALQVACMLAGLMQLALGYLRAGIIGAFFPVAVIEGMLAAIGLILIIKQIPHATGYDSRFEGDEGYMDETAAEGLLAFFSAFQGITPGAVVISSVALVLLIIWNLPVINRLPRLKSIPGALLAVIWGVGYNLLATRFFPDWAVGGKHLVSLQVSASPSEFFSYLTLPTVAYWAHLANPQVYVTAATIAFIASLETLLSLEATDKLDPLKRLAPTNRELKAQGVGNILSGLLGGLPITAVIVRSAANINAGGKTRMASFSHGVLLLLSIMFFAYYLNFIPLACLAAILLHTGYKLANPKLFKQFYQKGLNQFVPFACTVTAIIATDLLIGMVIGMAIGLFFVIKTNYHAAITFIQEGGHVTLMLNKDVSFINKALLRKLILHIPANSTVTIDASKARFIDHDIMETLVNFLASAPDDGIRVETINLHGKEKVHKHQTIIIKG